MTDARAPWSIVRRLALSFGVSAFAILVLASGALYWALKDNLVREDRDSLMGEMQVLRAILRERPHDRRALEQEVLWEGVVHGRTALYRRVAGAPAHGTLATPGMDALLPASAFPAADAGARILWNRRIGGRTFLLGAMYAPIGAGPERAVVQVALDVSRERELLDAYRRRLMAVLLAGVVLSAAAGALVAARGLRPLQQVARVTRSIGAHRLDERLDTERLPREVQDVARAFNAMLARLQEAFARLNRFAADLAHELRTPINNLMGEAEVALAKPRAPEEYREVLGSALEEYAQLARTIDSLLFLARADRPDARVERRALNARAEVESLCEFYQALAQEQGVQLRCEGEATVMADSGLLRRAVANLIDNALKHTAHGGHVDVGVSARDGATEIRVRDDGAGIADEHLPRVFERFYHAGPRRGAGLGLALVKSIMELHGGDVRVTSRVGAGSEFVLRFPAATAAAGAEPQATSIA